MRYAAYTIEQFCEAYHCPREYYEVLKQQYLAPDEIKLGDQVIIPRRTAEEWEKRMAARQSQPGVVLP
ncbi:hypothetical protein SAMN05216412_101345 [Nitrosospira multiformis]|uniref:Uncharacterized protein n=1 Tax=Nitrosospira multiformis TaxID=1231 RepID=A0A1H9YR25_9PROT|nr:hypothetical protein [Nitrosospira multiformis]SES71603.1 hypothetical protein SAMN05216412_101345 [Nitrosospira multiformis]